MSRSSRAALALAFYLLVTLLVAAPLPVHLLDTVPRAVRPDTWLNVWALAWTSEHLFSDPADLFDANIFHPRRRTLAYSDHFIGQALLAAPVWWGTRNPALTYNVAWYLALALTGWGGYLWVRRLLDDRPCAEAGALVAGVVCLLVPGKRVAFGHLQVISLQAVPLALLAAHAVLRRPGPVAALALAAAVAWAALCSWYTAAYVGLLLPAVGLAGVALTAGGRRRRRVAAWGGGGLALAAGILAPVALPYVRVQSELGIQRPVEELVATSLRPADWLASWSWLHEPFMPAGSGAGGHFPGWTALLLGLTGVLLAIRDRRPWPLVYGTLALGFAVLSLGPELRVGETVWPLPYGLLHGWMPGFGALRNPYRAAFVAILLVAPLVGLGAAGLVDAARRRRGPAAPDGLPVAGLLALTLAGLHLLEAWPGPQQVAPLPDTATPAHRWLAAHEAGGAALELPLPDPPDLNARYQLGTVGTWTPLANGHSGLYPPELLELYDVEAAFPSPELLGAVKERYPVEWIILHHERMPGRRARERAAAAPDLEAVWSRDDTVIYRLAAGAPAGWLRRRRRGASLTGTLVLSMSEPGACRPRIALDGEPVGVTAVDREAAGLRVSLDLPPEVPELVDLEVWLTRPGQDPPVALEARAGSTAPLEGEETRPSGAGGRPGEGGGRAAVWVNGWPVARGPVALARVDGTDGRLEAARSSRPEGAADALRGLLAEAEAGDWIGVAATEDPAGDPLLVERLRLLADEAGGAVPAGPLEEEAGAWALVGRVGSAVGSAAEQDGPRSAGATAPTPIPGCLAGPVRDLRFVR